MEIDINIIISFVSLGISFGALGVSFYLYKESLKNPSLQYVNKLENLLSSIDIKLKNILRDNLELTKQDIIKELHIIAKDNSIKDANYLNNYLLFVINKIFFNKIDKKHDEIIVLPENRQLVYQASR